jgi:hypothetical protein
MAKVAPDEGGPGGSDWTEQLFRLLSRVIPVGSLVKRAWEFVKDVVMLPEAKERRQVENLEGYLKIVDKLAGDLKRRGVADEEIRALMLEMGVPAVQSTLEAMLVRRAVMRSGPTVVVVSGAIGDLKTSPQDPTRSPTELEPEQRQLPSAMATESLASKPKKKKKRAKSQDDQT